MIQTDFVPSDQIVTNARLDYDVEDSSLRWYTLTVFVNDSLNENSLTLNIHIEDINDNDPVFENSSYTFEVCIYYALDSCRGY